MDNEKKRPSVSERHQAPGVRRGSLLERAMREEARVEQLSREVDLLRDGLALAAEGLRGCVDADRDDLWTVTAKRAIAQLSALGLVTENGTLYPEHTPIGWGTNPRYGLDFNGVCVACGRKP